MLSRPSIVLFAAVLFVGAVPGVASAHSTDGRSMPLVVRGDVWHLDDDHDGGAAMDRFNYGRDGDLPVVGDWNGDGSATPGVWRGSDGVFYLRNAYGSGAADEVVEIGRAGDVPVSGDWDGDGRDDVGVFRDGTWHYDLDLDGVVDRRFRYGRAGDVPVTGEWDGDGVDEPGVVRGATWHLRHHNSSGAADTTFRFGQPDDVPVVGRWMQTAEDHPGVFRDGTWYLRFDLRAGPADSRFRYGRHGDRPLTWRTADVARDVYAYTVGTEGDPSGDLGRFAQIARRVLNDIRGWSLEGDIRYERVESGGDFHLWLTDDDDVGEKSPVCSDDWSCTVGDDIYINDDNWNNATATWDARERVDYRRYVLNHEVGHWLGLDHYNDSSYCDADGDAPVMMQQSKNLYGCRTNVWPLPFEKQRARESRP